MLSPFWAGLTAGIIGIILPSLITFAILIARAPEIADGRQQS